MLDLNMKKEKEKGREHNSKKEEIRITDRKIRNWMDG